MAGMPLNVTWQDIALRLVLTILAGILIGYDRTEHGKAAGLRTTVLVCVAASVAMIQVNLLLPMAGKPADSFITNDLLRLPLGILTGVGFIGGGAIIKRDDIVVGVTTAATLWAVTVIGLCFGGGQIWLGLAATAISLTALWTFKEVEKRMRRERRAALYLEMNGDGPADASIRQMIEATGLKIASECLLSSDAGSHREMSLDVIEHRTPRDHLPPTIYQRLLTERGVTKVKWQLL
jgi:putative Mg2+ transporter-C (MgtC) family protein